MQKPSGPKLQSLAEAEPLARAAKQKLTSALASIQATAAQQSAGLAEAVRAGAALVAATPNTLYKAECFLAEAADTLAILEQASKRAPSHAVAPRTGEIGVVEYGALSSADRRDFLAAGGQIVSGAGSQTHRAPRANVLTREAFDKLSAAQKMEHFRNGGRLID